MKLVSISDTQIKLELETTDQEEKQLLLPKENVHYWYPFNINFWYKYSTAKDYMYLVMDKHYEGDNIYGTDILKRTQELPTKDGVPFNRTVFNRNKCVIDKARIMAIPTITDNYNVDQIEYGFETVAVAISDLKEMIESRFYKETEGYSILQYTEIWDKKIYSCATESELDELKWLGEIYTMLTIMKKLKH